MPKKMETKTETEYWHLCVLGLTLKSSFAKAFLVNLSVTSEAQHINDELWGPRDHLATRGKARPPPRTPPPHRSSPNKLCFSQQPMRDQLRRIWPITSQDSCRCVPGVWSDSAVHGITQEWTLRGCLLKHWIVKLNLTSSSFRPIKQTRNNQLME